MWTDGAADRPPLGVTSRTLRAFGGALCFDGVAWRWSDDGSIEAAAVSVPLSAFIAGVAEPITRYGRRVVAIFPDRLRGLEPDVLSVVMEIVQRHGTPRIVHHERDQGGKQGFVVDAAWWGQETARVFGVCVPDSDRDRVVDRSVRIVRERERTALTAAAQERVRRLTEDEPFRTIGERYSDRLLRNFAALERYFAQTLDEGSPAFLAACERAFADIAAPGGSDFLLFDDSDCAQMAAPIVASIKRGG